VGYAGAFAAWQPSTTAAAAASRAEERSDFEVFGEFGKFVSSSSSEDEDKGAEKGHAAGAANAGPRLGAEAAIVPPPGQHPCRVAAAAAEAWSPKAEDPVQVQDRGLDDNGDIETVELV
jgi:hypothetical protein